MLQCLFCKIIDGSIQANITYSDDLVIAFDDIKPRAPIHKLIIPKKHIATLNDLTEDDAKLFGHMGIVAKKLANDAGVSHDGYRIIINCNGNGGQEIFHMHMHLLAGRQLTWPPG